MIVNEWEVMTSLIGDDDREQVEENDVIAQQDKRRDEMRKVVASKNITPRDNREREIPKLECEWGCWKERIRYVSTQEERMMQGRDIPSYF